eukprot:3522922-Pleurochrysis_carterae.AAC.3
MQIQSLGRRVATPLPTASDKSRAPGSQFCAGNQAAPVCSILNSENHGHTSCETMASGGEPN